MKPLPICFVLAALAAASVTQADEPQSLTAEVGDIAFQSGDGEITLVPIGETFSLGASTLGAAAWPPPKTRIDRLSITCDGFEDGKPLTLDHKAFERSVCDVTFEKGTKPMGGAPPPPEPDPATGEVPSEQYRAWLRDWLAFAESYDG